MRRGMWLSLALAAAVGAVTVATPPAPAQTKKIVYWTHWDQQPDFNKWYTEKSKEFQKKTGYEVEVVTIPYQGYEAKYLAALMGKSGAPDFSETWIISRTASRTPAPSLRTCGTSGAPNSAATRDTATSSSVSAKAPGM